MTNLAPDAQSQQRFVRTLVIGIAATTLLSIASLVTGVRLFGTQADPAGHLIHYSYHNGVTWSALCIVTVFHVFLLAGLVHRLRNAWRVAFAIPAIWVLTVAFVSWPELRKTEPGWGIILPLAIMTALGVWQTFSWRKQWSLCAALFTAPPAGTALHD